jgi:hypothetical protein
MFNQKFLISVLVLGCCAVPGSASLITYTDPVAFAAATSGDAFSDIAVTQGTNIGTSYTNDGVDFTDSLNLDGTQNLAGWPAGQVITAVAGAFNGASTNTITISLPSAVTAIEFYTYDSQYNYIYFSINDGSGTITPYLNPTTSAPLFYGVTTTSSFISFSLSDEEGVGQLAIGDIRIGEADPPPTPEAATLLLVGTGLFLMGYWRRRMPGRGARGGGSGIPAKPKAASGMIPNTLGA